MSILLQCVSQFVKPRYSKLRCTKSSQHEKCQVIEIVSNQSRKIGIKSWNVLFFGSDNFSLRSLQVLHDALKEGLLHRLEIVTAYKGNDNVVREYAKKHKLTVHNWPLETHMENFEIGVVVSFGYLIPSKIINFFSLGIINVHGSLLPRWRGAAPICYALMKGDSYTGISIVNIEPRRFDVGSVLKQEVIKVHPNETYTELYNKLANLGADLLKETVVTLPHVLKGAKQQDQENITYAPKISVETSFIKWNSMTAADIYNLQRALDQIYPLRTFFHNQVIKLLKVNKVSKLESMKFFQNHAAGTVIYDKQKKILYIACHKNSWLTIERVSIPGRRKLSASDFSSGYISNQGKKPCIFR